MPRVGCADNHAKSASALVHRGRSVGYLRGDARAGFAAQLPEAIAAKARSHSRLPGEIGLNWSLGQRRGMQRAPRWLRRQPRQVRQRACAPWAMGRFSAGRSARGPLATELNSFGYKVSKPQPPTWRGVGDDKSRHTVWDGSVPGVGPKTTTLSPPARACSVGGRPVLHGATRARVAQHRIRNLQSHQFEAAAADLTRSR